MEVTNLTGYTWFANTDMDTPTMFYNIYEEIDNRNYGITFDVNFKASNGTDWTNFEVLETDSFTMQYYIKYGGYTVYLVDNNWTSPNGWYEEAYRTITFTGGKDVTNNSLIGALTANGTLEYTGVDMTIADKLLAVNQIKQDIKVAIENKGVAMDNVRFTGYAEKIDMLPAVTSPAVVELTQAQYDALSVYDNNTYYLIVEE